MKIEKFSGTDPQLYKLVAPLVMSPGILRQNNNYPFKTSIHHIWFVTTETILFKDSFRSKSKHTTSQ